jgi:hypothetical protein
VGGIDDHRPAGRDGLLQALQQQVADLIPGSLHAGIPEEFSADHICGEHQARLAGFALQQGRQLAGEGGLATAGRADQQVTAQGGWGHPSILGAVAPMACRLLRSTRPRPQRQVIS